MKRIPTILSIIFCLSILTDVSAGTTSACLRGLPKRPAERRMTAVTPEVRRVLVVLAEFSDCKFSMSAPKSYYDAALNGKGFNQFEATGSVREWFDANSGGRFIPEFEVVGPVTLSRPSRYYGNNNPYGDDLHSDEMVEEACRLAAPLTDFGKFDEDGDGSVDFVYVYHAGRGESTYGSGADLWPRSGYLLQEGLWAQGNGVLIDSYAFSNEMGKEEPYGIGTFLYQYLIRLGLPVLSESNVGAPSCSPNKWDIMDTGFANNEARTPPNLSAAERMYFGWLVPNTLNTPRDVTLHALGTSNEAFMIPAGNNGNEYFLLEYRALEGWDAALPNHGLLVWHIDYDEEAWAAGNINADGSRPRAEIVKANNVEIVSESDAKLLEKLAGWCYPGSTANTELSDKSVPSMRNRNGEATGFPLANITENADFTAVSFTAGDPLLAGIPVGIAPGSEGIGDDWFEASWNPVEGVDTYLLTIYAGKEKHSGSAVCDFGTGSNLSLPYGWETTAATGYTSPTYCGKAAPSIRLKDDGASIHTIRVGAAITEFSFWGRSVTAGNSTLNISGRDADNRWHNIATLNLPEGGDTFSFSGDEIPAGILQLRFIFQRLAGSFAIDDITIHYGEEPIVCEGYDRVPVTGTSMVIDRLPENEDSYYFTVRAITPDGETEESVPVSVLLGRADIATPEAEAALKTEGRRLSASHEFEVYTTSGIRIGRGREVEVPTEGLYIVRHLIGAGAKTEKLVVGVK